MIKRCVTSEGAIVSEFICVFGLCLFVLMMLLM